MRTEPRTTWTRSWKTASARSERLPEAPSATAVIAAAGSGERLGAGGPKAFVDVGGRPLIEWSLEACLEAASIGAIVVAVPPGEEARLASLGVETVPGGSMRSDSVAAALERVGTDLVVIHDAARPFVTATFIDELVAELAGTPSADAVIAAAPVTDTIKEARDGKVAHTLDRSKLWGAQTPQVFRTAKLREAIDLDSEATDEAMLIEAAGGTVLLRETAGPNFKVTTPDDLRLAEALLGG